MISPTACGALFSARTTPQPSETFVEPSWNLSSGPDHPGAYLIWAETPKLPAVGEKRGKHTVTLGNKDTMLLNPREPRPSTQIRFGRTPRSSSPRCPSSGACAWAAAGSRRWRRSTASAGLSLATSPGSHTRRLSAPGERFVGWIRCRYDSFLRVSYVITSLSLFG